MRPLGYSLPQSVTLGYTPYEDITAESEPDYDAWGPDSYWRCAEWLTWHKKLEAKYGLSKANEIWQHAWSQQGAFDYALNACNYNTDFVDYMLSKGIDNRTFISAIWTNIVKAGVNVSETGANVSDSAASIGKHLKWIVPLAAGVAVVGLGYFAVTRIETLQKILK